MVSPLNGGVDGRQRGHVEDAAHGAGWRQDVRRPSGAKQDGTDGHALGHDAFRALNVMLAASRFGMMSRLAARSAAHRGWSD